MNGQSHEYSKVIYQAYENTNKRLVLTLNTGEVYKEISEYTFPTIIEYVKKINADFISITDNKCSTPHWEKFQIYEYLNKYDRIIYFDIDLIIRSDCPDLFEIVPEDSIGMFEEGQFTDRSKELIIDTCKQYNIKLNEWDGKYYNSGVIVISKQHQILFKKPDFEYCSFYEQTYLNMMLSFLRVKVFGLSYVYNRMSCMDKFIGEDRHNSFIIHYAGFLFNTSPENLLEIIKKDLYIWKVNGTDYKYKKHILVSVNGGMGDQICAEPAIRFMREKLYPESEFFVVTHFPRIFKHLEKLGIKVFLHGEEKIHADTPFYIVQSLPNPDTMQWAIVSHLLCHTVDYSSIALMKRLLPMNNKTLDFELIGDDFINLYKFIPEDTDFSKLVVVHPGKHWETKTFPADYWQAIIDGLFNLGIKVCVIGKDEKGDPPDFIHGARGTVNVTCGLGVYDLRNKFDIGTLAALLFKAKVLISNDSSPIHLAGAFDNWIVVIPSCKHPDHILPYRNGRVSYKTLALYKKLVIDDVESRPTQVYPTSVDIKINDWNDYLIEPSKVVSGLLELVKE